MGLKVRLIMLKDKLEKTQASIKSFEIGNFFPSMNSLRTMDSISLEAREDIRESGRQALTEDIPSLRATQYMEFRRNGNRSHFEALYFRRRILLVRMLKAYCFGEESSEMLDGIINMISAICDEWSWVIPAHNWPNDETGKTLPPLEPPRVDLFAANTACLMALCVHYLKESLMVEADQLVERVETECRRRCINPYMQNDDHWWMGYHDHPEHGELNNWTPWITDNFLHCLLCLEPEQRELKAAAGRSSDILNNYLNVLPADGGCDEGAIYWDHAAGSLFGCLDILDFVSGGTLQLMEDQFVKDAASYIRRVHIDGSYYANFADCPGVLEHMPFGLMYRMAELLGDKELSHLACRLNSLSSGDNSHEEAFSVHRDFRNYLFPIQDIETVPEGGVGFDVFPDTQVYLHKSQDLFFSCKGGHNAESHNHNDVGQFMVYWKGQPGVIDPGIGEYTRETFNHMRYTIWTMQSGWHNLPVINSMKQKEGREFRSSSFITDADSCRIGLENAYPMTAGIKSWNRTFDVSDNEVCLTDFWELKAEKNSAVWHFLSLEEPVLSEGSAVIPLAEGKIVISFPEDLLKGCLDFQKIPEDDSKMRVWGKGRIWRISLENKNPLAAAGKVQFKIKGE